MKLCLSFEFRSDSLHSTTSIEFFENIYISAAKNASSQVLPLRRSLSFMMERPVHAEELAHPFDRVPDAMDINKWEADHQLVSITKYFMNFCKISRPSQSFPTSFSSSRLRYAS